MDQEKLRLLLCELGAAIRSKVVSARQGLSAEKLAAVTGDAGGDTIFAIDRFGADPAVASSVFVTMMTDTLGFLSFLGLATLVGVASLS